MPIYLKDLIQRVPPEVEAKVKRVRDQTRPAVQDALRAECRLVLRTPGDAGGNRVGAQVSVEVAPGHPAVLADVEFPDDFEHILLLGRYRTVLEQALTGASGLLCLREKLSRRPQPNQWIQSTEEELRSIANWARFLLALLEKHDPLRTVLAVDRDTLGVYEYEVRNGIPLDEYAVNRAVIRLYWGVIGLVSEWMGCTVEDLAVVVLTHELGHAYTQLGADIEGRRWSAPVFSAVETGLKEGLAQYYTERVLQRLERRHPGALSVYRTMLPLQPDAYRTHESWVKEFSPEAVRRAMLEVRRWQEKLLADFSRRLEDAQTELDPG